ncbi:MAG: endopeptidase La [Myxococcota bacterium]
MGDAHLEIDWPIGFLPLRVGVALPGNITTIPIGRERSVTLANSLSSGDILGIGIQKDSKVDDPSLADLHQTAVLARVKEVVQRGRRGVLLTAETLQRFHPTSLVQSAPFWKVHGTLIESSNAETEEAKALAESLKNRVKQLTPNEDALKRSLEKTRDPGSVADKITSGLALSAEDKLPILLELDVEERLRKVVDLLAKAKTRAELKERVDSEVRRELTQSQKEAMLRQQLRAIQKELGDEEPTDELDSLNDRLQRAELSEDLRKSVDREFKRLRGMPAGHAEAGVIRNYLELIADLPWQARAEARFDLEEVSARLEADHHGLDSVKRRILEHMAVLKLGGEARGTILCLSGPPGVGKTSLAQSVAEATGRPLQRISLGGVRDEAEIRGHRRTYVGSLPGRILAALRKSKVKNPVIVLDEIDKLGRDFRGDPESALLEALDPEQNANFTDHYLEHPFDLSEVMFLATANELSRLSTPLRDRLEIIEISGYTTQEKVAIAQDFLIEKQLLRHGLDARALSINESMIGTIVRDYTREAGVRQLSREVAKICRAIALSVARGTKKEGAVTLDEARLRETLGRPKFLDDRAESTFVPGIASGLAWTPVGGEVLYVETTRMKGTGKVEITGQLGEVMRESARAALAYLRTHARSLGVDPSVFEESDLHIHVPAGAVPKDGPSAGVTMFTALASLFSGRRSRSDTAMTGEATLRGRVLPVGGIKEKILAAHRAGFERVILPARNQADLEEVPGSARADIEVIFASDMHEVLDAALETDRVEQDAAFETRTAPNADTKDRRGETDHRSRN